MNSTAPRPRRRWLRRLLILAVLFALLFALAPTLSAPLVRARLEAALTERTGGEVTLESLSLSWPGSATLEGLVLRGPDGDEHARVGRAHASVGLLAALRGRYLAQVEVEDWFARAERRPDGSWSLEELIKGDEARGGDPESPQSTEPPQASEPPFVQARVQLSDGTLELHDGDQTATCTLGRVCLDLVGLDRPAPFEVAGDLTAAGPYALEAGTLSLSGELTIEPELVVDAALEVAGRSLRAPGEVAEETVELSTALEFDGASVAVAELHLESSIVSGDLKGRLEGIAGEELALRGVQGDLTYLPDALGKLLAPHLPGELSGAEPERLEITFDGPLASFSLDDLLSGCEGRSHLGLGLFSAYGIEARGGLGVDVGEGRLQLDGQLEAAGGALNLGASYSQDGARLSLALDGARASAQLAPLLGELHPVFAGLDQIEGASLEGALTAELELSVDGPVSLTGLTEGFDLSRVRGRGSLALDQGRLRGSPLLSELLTALGEPAETALELAPMSFTLGGDRLDYAERWRWAIDGVDTWFSGGLTLDGGLDLVWEVPITRELAREHSVLEALEGGSLQVPLRGTVTAPELDWNAALEGVAEQALKARITEELGIDELGIDELSIDELLRGGDAPAILREADRLYSEGEKTEAAKLYSTLRKKHRLSTVYLLNKSRIDDRRKAPKER